MVTRLFRYLEDNKRQVVDLTAKLIRIRTVNPPGENYKEMVRFLEKSCKGMGLRTKRYVTPKKVLDRFKVKGGSRRINLIADWITGGNRTLHISAHYDVVPPTDNWRTDPFIPVIRGNRIYGRGAEDMKGNIACFLYTLQAVKDCHIKPKVNIQIAFTPDEEIGGRTGLGYLVKRNLVKADYAMSEGYSGDYVSIGNKGVLWAEVTVRGKACHASIPHKGVNSFERMVELASWFKKLEEKVRKKKTQYEMRDAISKSPTLVMGGILQGGVKVNVVPGVSRFSIDRRLVPEEDIETVKRQIQAVIDRFNKRYKDSSAHVRFLSKEPASISKKDHGFFRVVSDSIRSVTGKKAKFSLMPGATDTRYFMWKGIPSIGYSAKGGESWHSDNEFVYIDSLVETAKVYALVLSRLE